MEFYNKNRLFILWIVVFAPCLNCIHACRQYEFTRTKISAFRLQKRLCEGYKMYKNGDGLYLYFAPALKVWAIGSKPCNYYNVMAHGIQPETKTDSVDKIQKWMVMSIGSEWKKFNDRLRCADDGIRNIAPTIECGGQNVTITLSPALLRHGAIMNIGGDRKHSICRPQRRRDKTKPAIINFPLDRCQPKLTLGDDTIVLTYSLHKTHRTFDRDGKMTKLAGTSEVSCQYPRKSHAEANLFRAKQIVYRSFAKDSGHFDFEITLHKHTNLFKQTYKDGGNIMIGQRVYTRVKLLSDVNLNLFVKNCVATPSKGVTIRHPKLKHYLINPLGCYADHTFQYEWQSSKQYVYSFKMFQFLDPDHAGQRLQRMNLQCDVFVCPYNSRNHHCKLPRDCSSEVNKKKRSKREAIELRESSPPQVFSVSFGFNVKDAPADNPRPDRYISLKDLSPSTTAGAAIIGILGISTVVGAALAIILHSTTKRPLMGGVKQYHVDT